MQYWELIYRPYLGFYNALTLTHHALQLLCRGDGGIGRRSGLKIRRWKHLVGSTPTRPT
jgi:hypothetical protein